MNAAQNKRIGILTLINTLNYGAELQAFALQTAINQLGYTSEVINYAEDVVQSREQPRIPSVRHSLRHPLMAAREMVNYGKKVQRAKGFSEFRKKRMSYGCEVLDQKGIASLYDVVVVGSDQVWNLDCTGGDLAFFLNEVPRDEVTRVAFAASFGSAHFPRELVDTCGFALKSFEAIGVRESSGIDIVRRLSGQRAVQVLDPTLLLSKREWLSVCDPKYINDDYIFVYLVSEKDEALEFARAQSEKLGCRLIVLDCYGAPPIGRRHEYVNDASPEEFLSLIRDARLVVTSSFHGLALSLCLGSNVYYSLDKKKNNANSRLRHLAELARITDHEISSFSSLQNINYLSVDAKIRAERSRSLAFLSDALASSVQL